MHLLNETTYLVHKQDLVPCQWGHFIFRGKHFKAKSTFLHNKIAPQCRPVPRCLETPSTATFSNIIPINYISAIQGEKASRNEYAK